MPKFYDFEGRNKGRKKSNPEKSHSLYRKSEDC